MGDFSKKLCMCIKDSKPLIRDGDDGRKKIERKRGEKERGKEREVYVGREEVDKCGDCHFSMTAWH